MSSRVVYTSDDNMITKQNRAEKEFLAAFEKDKPTLENAHVHVNPYFINPLCALILFKTAGPETATLTIHGKNNAREDIVHTTKATDSHALPVVGLYEGIETKVSVKLSGGGYREFMIKSQPLPEKTSRCRNISTSLDYFGTNFMFLTPALQNMPVAFDYAGNIRWMLNVGTMFDIKRLKNGNIMTGSFRYCRMPYNATGLIELNLLGKIYKEYRMPGNYHHDHFEMPDGNILALTQDFSAGSKTVEDMIVLLDRNTGEVLKSWDYKKESPTDPVNDGTKYNKDSKKKYLGLPQDVGGSGSQDAHDWFHNNALWYNEKNNTVTISGRHQDAVVNFDYDTGKVNWIIGDPEGWPDYMQKYFFKPVGDVKNFDWQYEQHACVVCPDGDIMCFDNGQWRAKKKEKYIKNRDNFSRGVRYRINTAKMEIEQIWQYGKELGQDFFSPYICNVEYYADGHYLIHSGGMGWESGFASDGLGAFLDTSKPGVDTCSKTVEQKDGVVQFYLEVDDNFYRAEKLSAYHDGDNCIFGEGKLLGHLDETPTFDTIPDLPEKCELISDWHQIQIEEDEDRIVFHGRFERGSLAMVLFQSDKEKRGYYINTAASFKLAMCSGAFLEKDDRVIKMNISKQGLSGEYKIKVLLEDAVYQTGVSLFC